MPEIEAEETFYLRSFHDLSTGRSMGMGVGHIAWRDMLDYGQYKGLEPDVLEAFIQIIKIMDMAYVDAISAEKTEAP